MFKKVILFSMVLAAGSGSLYAMEKNESKKIQKDKQKIECVVCTDEFSPNSAKLMKLPCGKYSKGQAKDHTFCKECLVKWAKKASKFSCPNCKTEFPKSLVIGKQERLSAWWQANKGEVKTIALGSLGTIGLFLLFGTHVQALGSIENISDAVDSCNGFYC